jgi:hypothetical protein
MQCRQHGTHPIGPWDATISQPDTGSPACHQATAPERPAPAISPAFILSGCGFLHFYVQK